MFLFKVDPVVVIVASSNVVISIPQNYGLCVSRNLQIILWLPVPHFPCIRMYALRLKDDKIVDLHIGQ